MQIFGQNQNFSMIQRLAILTKIRMELCNADAIGEQHISHLLQNTSIIEIVLSILGSNNGFDDIVTFLKLESGWILTNMAYGDDKSLEILFDQSNVNMNLNFNQILGSIFNQ